MSLCAVQWKLKYVFTCQVPAQISYQEIPRSSWEENHWEENAPVLHACQHLSFMTCLLRRSYYWRGKATSLTSLTGDLRFSILFCKRPRILYLSHRRSVLHIKYHNLLNIFVTWHQSLPRCWLPLKHNSCTQSKIPTNLFTHWLVIITSDDPRKLHVYLFTRISQTKKKQPTPHQKKTPHPKPNRLAWPCTFSGHTEFPLGASC